MNAEQPTPAVSEAVRSFLDQQRVLTLATASPVGLPHAADLFYVTQDLAIYFWTRADTVTARHVDENPRVAFTVRGEVADPAAVRGVQGAGDCRVLLAPDEIDEVVRLFAAKYPELGDNRHHGVSFFRLTPSQIGYIDNRRAASHPAGVGMDFHREVVLSVLRELPAEDVEAVAGQLEPQVAEEGEVIVRQGAPADKFFIIVSGEVEVSRTEDGRERHLATLRRGQFFGELAILRDMPRTATVTAVSETTLLTMDHDSFRRVVAQSLATTEDFDDVVRARLRAM